MYAKTISKFRIIPPGPAFSNWMPGEAHTSLHIHTHTNNTQSKHKDYCMYKTFVEKALRCEK